MKRVKHLDVSETQLAELRGKLDRQELAPADFEQLKSVIDTVLYLADRYRKATSSMKRVLKMIFGASTEKTAHVLDQKPEKEAPPKPKRKRKGHGRRAADEYPGAENIHVPHESLRPGQDCPDCQKGVIGDTQRPSVLIRLCAQPLVKATAYVIEKLRCSLCGKLFSATTPEAALEKYDPNVAPMLATARYGYGLPMNRLAAMQAAFGVPLPTGTQWELIQVLYNEVGPVVWAEMLRQAAKGGVVHNDDTNGRVLELEQTIREQKAKQGDKIRTGVFTTGIVSVGEAEKIALYFTGRQHAGENLQDVLAQRPGDLPPPIQMCDGLNRNEPECHTIEGNCTVHGRREFVEISDHFPAECAYVLETVKSVYKHEAHTVEQNMSPDQRLRYHQQESGPLFEKMKLWMEEQSRNKLVEPNGELGKAIKYVLKRWDKLTLFLRKAGAPLDNNICERILKTPIRHRDNSLFYKTVNGAKVGDFFMGVIQTCRLTGKDPFHYLTTIRRFAQKLRENPSAWMPWNYLETVAGLPGP